MPSTNDNEWLTTKQAMAYLGVSRTTLGRLAKRVPIPRAKSGGIVRYRKSSLDRALGRTETIH